MNKKKIGFIDYYLDEWHANNYPKMISSATDLMEVAYAYGAIDAPCGIPNSAWCEKNRVLMASSIDELVDCCDYIVVLSPDNPEYHEALSHVPLMSGKRVYIDKTFALTKTEAQRMFDHAQKYGTPVYSTSALRFSKELENVEKRGIGFISSRGPGMFENYLIHQFEPIVMLMGPKVKRVMFIGNGVSPAFLIEFSDGRRAITSHFGVECQFGMTINYESADCVAIDRCTGYFEEFIANMVDYFNTGVVKVPAEETIAIVGLIESSIKAKSNPDRWVDMP